MSREFCLETSLKVWDFIFSGIDEGMLSSFNAQGPDSTSVDYDTLLKEPRIDPFINLECLSVAMIALIKSDLLESDFSMCLGLLMSYSEPNEPATVLEHAQKVRESLLKNVHYARLPSPTPQA